MGHLDLGGIDIYMVGIFKTIILKFFYLMFLFSNFCFGQNLIQNGGFEDMFSCPKSTQINRFWANNNPIVPYWSSPTKASPDYFNSCGGSKVSPPNTLFGEVIVDSSNGKGLMGIHVGDINDSLNVRKVYREYVTTTLKTKLINGKKYNVSFSLCLAGGSNYSVSELGISMSEKKIKKQTNSLLKTPFISIPINKDSTGWQKVSFSYIAKGEELYFVFGNFLGVQKTDYFKIRNSKSLFSNISYYFIDNFKIEEPVQIYSE